MYSVLSKIFFVLCCFLCVQEEPTLSWDEAYKLTWEDFKGESNHDISAVAITASGISFGFSFKQTDTDIISFTTNVFTHFYPEQSWYKPDIADANVLGHEQLHFDITELFARKFRQRISHLKVSNAIRSELESLNKTINKELSVMQNTYDSETDFSRNFEQQDKWKVYIANALQNLSNYKSIK